MTSPLTMQNLGLKFNPFPPAATGAAFLSNIWLPNSWTEKITDHLDQLQAGSGAKATVVVGGYGTGKTLLLQWMLHNEFPRRRIRPYFFDNPGVAFYSLANELLRQIGRYELSKSMWELLYEPDESLNLQRPLIELSFRNWLDSLDRRRGKIRAIDGLAQSMLAKSLTDDEEIAHRFSTLVVETKERPFYQFRDFTPRSPNSLVSEQREAHYFQTIIRVLASVFEVEGISFLIDEFEDVALGKLLPRRQSTEYIVTLRRLLDTASEENFWLTISITPEALEQTNSIEPALMERFGSPIYIPNLSEDDAYKLVAHRLKEARIDEGRNALWPFDDEALDSISPTNWAIPRRLIKIFWQSLALASRRQLNPPIPNSVVSEAEELLLQNF